MVQRDTSVVQMAQLLLSPFPAIEVSGVCVPAWWALAALCSVDASDGHQKQAGRWDNPGLSSFCRLLASYCRALGPAKTSGCLCADPLVPHACSKLHSLFGSHQKVLGGTAELPSRDAEGSLHLCPASTKLTWKLELEIQITES